MNGWMDVWCVVSDPGAPNTERGRRRLCCSFYILGVWRWGREDWQTARSRKLQKSDKKHLQSCRDKWSEQASEESWKKPLRLYYWISLCPCVCVCVCALISREFALCIAKRGDPPQRSRTHLFPTTYTLEILSHTVKFLLIYRLDLDNIICTMSDVICCGKPFSMGIDWNIWYPVKCIYWWSWLKMSAIIFTDFRTQFHQRKIPGERTKWYLRGNFVSHDTHWLLYKFQ